MGSGASLTTLTSAVDIGFCAMPVADATIDNMMTRPYHTRNHSLLDDEKSLNEVSFCR